MVRCALPFGDLCLIPGINYVQWLWMAFDVPHDYHAYNNTPVIAPTSVFFVHGKIEVSSLALFFRTYNFLLTCYLNVIIEEMRVNIYLSMTGQAKQVRDQNDRKYLLKSCFLALPMAWTGLNIQPAC